MTVTLYRSSDASAPTLSGTVGDLVNVLDKCLVAGYGSKSAAGWTKPYTGTNGAVFTQGYGSNEYSLRCNYNGPGAGTGKEARVYGAESFSAFATGTSLFPTAAQMANGLFVRKSGSADAVVRQWVVLADSRTMYMFIASGDVANHYLGWMFGEIYSFKTSDLGRCMLISRGTENSTSVATTIEGLPVFQNSLTVVTNGTFLARDAVGNVGASAAGLNGDAANSIVTNASIGVLAAANPADNKYYLAPIRIYHTVGGNTYRGRLRGLWHFCHPLTAVSDGDTFSGTGDLAGKTFLILKLAGNSNCVYCLETSNTWDAN
jgi:hypothetical protein